MWTPLSAVHDALKRTEKVVDRHIAGMLQHFAGSNMNPMAKDDVLPFSAVVKAANVYFKKLLIPQQFLKDMVVQFVPMLPVMAHYAERIVSDFQTERHYGRQYNEPKSL